MTRSLGYRLTVAGPLPQAVVRTIRARFDPVAIHPARDGTVVDVGPVEQPTLRALLTLLWDGGHDVIDVTANPTRME